MRRWPLLRNSIFFHKPHSIFLFLFYCMSPERSLYVKKRIYKIEIKKNIQEPQGIMFFSQPFDNAV